MPPPTLAQDRLARAQHANTTNHSSHSNRGRGGASFSGFAPRGNASSASGTRGGRAASTTTSGSRGGGVGQGRSVGGEARLTGEEARGARNNEMWEDRQRRHKAAMVLGSWEMLAWYAIAGDEVRVCLFLLCLWCNKVVPRGDGGKGPGGGMLRRTEVAKKTSE
jgi:hypothetical protein